jgi:hypothetical protein
MMQKMLNYDEDEDDDKSEEEDDKEAIDRNNGSPEK